MQIVKLEQSLTMSTREIAELTGKQHQHVKRDTEVMFTELEKDTSSFGHIYLDSMNRQQTEYLLDKELTMTLVAGYNIKIRHAIVKRWQELEVAIMQPVKQVPEARAYLEDMLEVMKLFQVPLHLAQTESVKLTSQVKGVDYSAALLVAPAQSNIKPEEQMLEPTELGKFYGLSARSVNFILQLAGLQIKEGSDWLPTDKAFGNYVTHQWKKLGKTGYNLKWNVKFVEPFLK